MNERLQDGLVRSLVATADDARERAAWRIGMPNSPPRIEWPDPEPVQVLPPAIVQRPAEPKPKSNIWKKIGIGAAIVAGTTGIGAGAAYVGHLLQPPVQPPAVQPAADVVQWLGEHGYDRPQE